MTRLLKRLRRNERGATLIEYALIISLVVLMMVGGLKMFASEAINMLNHVSTEVISNA